MTSRRNKETLLDPPFWVALAILAAFAGWVVGFGNGVMAERDHRSNASISAEPDE